MKGNSYALYIAANAYHSCICKVKSREVYEQLNLMKQKTKANSWMDKKTLYGSFLGKLKTVVMGTKGIS